MDLKNISTGDLELSSSAPDGNTTKHSYTENELLYLNCWYRSSISVHREPDLVYCEPVFDGVACWTAVPANNTVQMKCPIENAPEDIFASRFCTLSGQWENKSDYTECIKFINNLTHKPEPEETNTHLAMVLRDIYFVCSILSLICLIITLFIFIYFRSLQCNRISIHKNLVVSFIVRFVVLIVIIEPFVTGRESSYRDVEWLCKIMLVLTQYTILANIYWMLVEGLFLHNSIVVSVFSTEAPFKLFFFIGWGLPSLIVTAWAIVMHFADFEKKCWNNYSQSHFTYIILVPFLAALIVNLIFLINIIRILVTKLRANNTMESDRIKKAIKATIVLMPLLGLTNVLFLWNPEDGSSLQTAYHVINAVLQSTQGIMVSIFYCFMNGEVRRVIRRKWDRFKIRRFLSSSRRRRSSRTSSFVLSQTEVTDLSEFTKLTTQAVKASENFTNHVDYQATTVENDDDAGNHVTSENEETKNQVGANHVISSSTPDSGVPLPPPPYDDTKEEVWVRQSHFDAMRETALVDDDDDDEEGGISDLGSRNTYDVKRAPYDADLMSNIASSGHFDWLEQFVEGENEKSAKQTSNGKHIPDEEHIDTVQEPIMNGRISEKVHLNNDKIISSPEAKASAEARNPVLKSSAVNNSQRDDVPLLLDNNNGDMDEWAEILQICESFKEFDKD